MDTAVDRDPLSGITVFVAAARADNFTQAANRLGLTKSSVGKTIARLEHRLGIKLFHRTTRLTRLTADGEAYLVACTSALDEITAAQTALSSSNRILSGRIHVDMPVAFGRRVLLPALIEITRPRPGLSLWLTFTDETTDLLHDALGYWAARASALAVSRAVTLTEWPAALSCLTNPEPMLPAPITRTFIRFPFEGLRSLTATAWLGSRHGLNCICFY